MEEALRLVVERHEIHDLMYRYASSLDNRDWSRLATCFIPDAVGIYGENVGRLEGYAAIEHLCRRALEPLDSSQHIISNIEFEHDSDLVRASSYLQAQHTRAGTPGGDNLTIGGKYIDEIVRTAGGWRLRQRELVVLWQEGNPAVLVL